MQAVRSRIFSLIGYLRLAIYVEFIGFGAFWVGLFLAAVIVHADALLLPLILPALHFVAPAVALKTLNYFEEKWKRKPGAPPRYELTEWVVLCLITILTDIIALVLGLRVDAPELEHEGHPVLAIVYLSFLGGLLKSSIILTLAQTFIWRYMKHYKHSNEADKAVDIPFNTPWK